MSITTFNSTDSGATIRTTLNNNFTDLDTTKADLASPALTGVPTAPTATGGTNTTQLATTAFVIANASAPTVETTTGTTHSLTTTTGQKVVVWAKGNIDMSGATTNDVTLNYNGVQKDIVRMVNSDAERDSFSLMYTETPGAATQNITVAATLVSGSPVGSLSNVVIIVMKIG